MSDSESDEPSYEVEEVLDTTGKPPNREFFVKWKGYDESENSWEPEENMYHLVVVQEYVKRKGLQPILDPEKEEERKQAEKEREKEKQRKKEEEREAERKKKKESSSAGPLSEDEVKRRWDEEVARRKAAKQKEQGKSERRAEKHLSTKEQRLAEKQKDELLTKQLESEGWKGFELYKEKCRRKEIEENGGVAVPSQPPAAIVARPPPVLRDSSPEITREKDVSKPKPKPPPVQALDYSSDEEIPITKVPLKKAPAPSPSAVQNGTRNSSMARDSSPEIPVIKSSGASRPRPKSPISSSSSSEDEAPGPVGSSKAMAASAARQTVKGLDSSPEPSDTEDRKKKEEDEDEAVGTGEPTYAVRKVLDMRGRAPDREFLVQWEGYDSDDDTWEPEEGVSHLLIVQKYIADRAAGKVGSSAGKSKKRDYSGTDEERTRKKEKDGKYGYSNFFNQPSTKGSYKQSSKYGAYSSNRGGRTAAGDIYEEGAPSLQNIAGYSMEDGVKKKTFLASSFRIPKAKGGDGKSEFIVEPAPDEKNGSPDSPGDYANDEEIREGGLNDDVAMAKMVLGLAINQPDRDRKPNKMTTKLPDDELIDSVTRPVDDSRFDDLYKRLQFLRIECTSKFSQEQKVPPVTATTHIFETAIPFLETQGWHRPVRTREVIGNYVDYFKKDLLPSYLKNTQGEKISGTDLINGKIDQKEIALYLRTQLKNPDVMRHLGRDVMNYEKEKSRAQTQRCVKMIQRPRIPVS